MTRPRQIAIGGVVHETCSRVARLTTLDDFDIWRGPALEATARGPLQRCLRT